jgi:hypothetical protein
MEIKNLRHEVKQSISFSDYRILQQMLVMISQQEETPVREERIHSLCFENEDKGLQAKKGGSSEKFTIRYQNEDMANLKLVKKTKKKDCSLERSSVLSQRDCQRIIAGDFEFLRGSEDPLLFEFYNHMKQGEIRPKILVDYSRETYIYRPGNVSVTIDSDFSTGFNLSDFLNDRHPTIKRTGQVILEVKYDKYLPEIIARLITSEKNARPGKLAFAAYRA